MYTVMTDYMEHEGGTKFYETVLISTGALSMLIKRYGAIAHKMGGGTVIVEKNGMSVNARARAAILAEKTRRRAQKGAYLMAARPSVGLHRCHHQTPLVGADIYNAARLHYSGATLAAIRDYFELSERTVAPEDADSRLVEVPVIRDKVWGSW